MVLASALPWVSEFAGTVYGAVAAICGALFPLLAGQLHWSTGADRHAAHRVFVFSIVYLFALFTALLIDHGRGSFSPIRSSLGGHTVGSVRAERLPGTVDSARSFINLSTSEV